MPITLKMRCPWLSATATAAPPPLVDEVWIEEVSWASAPCFTARERRALTWLRNVGLVFHQQVVDVKSEVILLGKQSKLGFDCGSLRNLEYEVLLSTHSKQDEVI